MQTDAKVVNLNRAAPAHSSAAAVGRLPAALISVGEKAVQQLKQALQALFDNADDTLFQMVDRSDSNGEHNDFFEAMRDLRLKRRGIEHGFLEKVRENFAALNRVEIGRPPVLENISFSNLSLMNTDVLEETVAVDAMVAKALCSDAAALGHLTIRFNVLISRKLDEKSNPLGPALLCESFVLACSGLGVEIRVKLIIFKLFEKYVLGQLGDLYGQSNQLLADAGVLPDLQSLPPRKTQVSRSSAEQRSATEVADVDADIDEAGMQHAFGVLQGLLSQVRGTGLSQRAQPIDGVPISSNDLMRLLSHLQQQRPTDAVEADMRDDLDQLLVRASVKSGRARMVGQVDDDVINLVSMLFEFILDDRSLPDSLKALISRLQIPLLKVAVMDKTFFGRGSHPARRLLNEIASASLGWADQDDSRRDSLYLKIEQVVHRLLNEFVDDPAIFTELLADFIAFTGNERRRSDLLEQRTRDAEEGRAKAEVARLQVEQALNARLLGKTLPHVVVTLLQESWSKVMLLACLKHGFASVEWQAALSTMDELIWSIEPHADEPGDRLQLLQRVPNILKSLRDGMTDAALDAFTVAAYFPQLETLHAIAFQGGRHAARVDPADSAVALKPVLVSDIADADGADEFASGDLSFVGMALQVADAAPPVMVEVVAEIVLLAPGEVRCLAEEVTLGENDEALQQVDNLHVGSWVELLGMDERKIRCKLAAILKHSSKYIFVNRNGMKVLEQTRMALALEFRHGAVRMLDDALLFDRALESVIGNLRRLKGN